MCEPHTKHYVIVHRRTVVGIRRAARFDSVESISILDYTVNSILLGYLTSLKSEHSIYSSFPKGTE